ncbi:MAG: transposase, partial [Mariprofundaceae bacterium]|nr:transposase [Mariprofundaceae bacterium]
VINVDNGPECSGHRTQWLKRMVELSDANQVSIQLAYYPPYHSKYNPVERLWGVLENHWKGKIFDSIDKALGLARSHDVPQFKANFLKNFKNLPIRYYSG